jgi:predicted Zn-dependent peptidase
MWDPYAEFESGNLPNGLTVHVAHWPKRPWEAMGFLIHSGAEHDPIGLEGLAHFVEHLVSNNTNLPNNEIHKFFNGHGGNAQLGGTTYTSVRYHFFVPADKTVMLKAFSIFGQMLLQAKLDNFIERERQVIKGEFFKHYPINFKFELDRRERKCLYPNYWLERFVRPLGTIDSIERITPRDLQVYYDTNYTSANMSIVGVGGMTLQEIIELLEASPFAENKKGARTPLPSPVTNFPYLLETHHSLAMSEHLSAPANVGAYRSVTKIPGDTNYGLIQIARIMLNNILNEEVREKRAWTYSINCEDYNFRHFFEFAIKCSGLKIEALNDIDHVIEDCITSMREREDLFERFKQCILARNLMCDHNGRTIREEALSDLAKYQKIGTLSDHSREVERATMEDVLNLLQWLKPERRWTLLTTP